MKLTYKCKLYAVSTMPQWQLLGKDKGYSEKISEGGNFKCFLYHFDKQRSLARSILDCDMGYGVYSNLTREQRLDESSRLKKLQEVHLLKAQIFGASCGREIY